jgi:acetoin utilization protein AcuB
MQVPSISRYMTAQPWTIEPDASLAEAYHLMREHGIRHLPVLDNGDLVGIISERDLHLLETVADFALSGTPVKEVMRERPFVVTSDAALDEVVDIMANAKYGSAIVMGHDGVEGIFTTIDACRALADVLQRAEAESLGVSSETFTHGV